MPTDLMQVDGLWPSARWQRDIDGAMERIVEAIAQGKQFRDMCAEFGWPKSMVWKWMAADPDRKAVFEGAYKARAHEYVDEVVGIADASDDAKLKVETRLKVAAKFDRERFGDKKTEEVSVFVGALTHELEVRASQLLKDRLARLPVTIDHESA